MILETSGSSPSETVVGSWVCRCGGGPGGGPGGGGADVFGGGETGVGAGSGSASAEPPPSTKKSPLEMAAVATQQVRDPAFSAPRVAHAAARMAHGLARVAGATAPRVAAVWRRGGWSIAGESMPATCPVTLHALHAAASMRQSTAAKPPLYVRRCLVGVRAHHTTAGDLQRPPHPHLLAPSMLWLDIDVCGAQRRQFR